MKILERLNNNYDFKVYSVVCLESGGGNIGRPCESPIETFHEVRHIDIHPLWFSKETNHLVGDLAILIVETFEKMSLDSVKLPPAFYYPNGKILKFHIFSNFIITKVDFR